MISVILPTYNRADWLPQSIRSIMEQDYRNWELIIVDDCSSDNTGDVVREFMEQDGRIKYIRNEVNKKLPASLNEGMKYASGEYITWTSDDSLYKSNAFSVMLSNIEKSSTNTGLVFAEFDKIDRDGKKIGCYKIPDDIRQLYWENIIGCAFLYKKKVVNQIGWYDEEKFLIEDYDYWLRIADCFDVVPIRKSIYETRVHERSLSTTRAKEVLRLKRDILNENLNRNIDDYIKQKIYAEIALISYSLDDYSTMNSCVQEARVIFPNIKFHKRVNRAMFLGEKLTKIYKKIRVNF